jgi:hypothetical protein
LLKEKVYSTALIYISQYYYKGRRGNMRNFTYQIGGEKLRYVLFKALENIINTGRR